jgi:N4-(beta-N-acetylglucosaminyl)-L-asparaginase
MAAPATAVVLSTWRFGLKANAVAGPLLAQGGAALDAVEAGVRVVESDPTERSVGKGGRPDREGKVTLDASIMNHRFEAGSVAALEHIENPISVARAVMEKTPHMMLVGEGALQFALAQGFQETNLLVPESEAEWQAWQAQQAAFHPVPNIENHDTIGCVAVDQHGHLAGACTTSGLAWKMHGRVGDSPIIGAGLYVHPDFGAAVATGHGEEAMRTVASFRLITLLMTGLSPTEACRAVIVEVERLFRLRQKDMGDTQLGLLVVTPDGRTGAFALRPGFQYARTLGDHTDLLDAPYLL